MPNLQMPGAFKHAEICQKTKDLVADMIQKDADNCHVFFNDKEFHNHAIQAILASFSLGADEESLKELFRLSEGHQRPKLPEKEGFQWDSPNCLHNEEYYTNYLNFFLKEIELKGIIPTIEEYIFKDRKAQMFHRFMMGFHHPIIHTGCGVEFGIPLMVAEGLANTAAHGAKLPKLYGNEPTKGRTEQVGKHVTALELVMATRDDKRFDGIIKFEKPSGNRGVSDIAEDYIVAITEKATEACLEYLDKFVVQEQLDGECGLRARAIELQVMGAVVCCGAQPPNKEPHFDFYGLHILTSSIFLQAFIEQLNPVYGASLLRGKFLIDLVVYLSRNRPAINLEQFKTYPKQPWEKILEVTFANPKEGKEREHIHKCVRALKHVARLDKSIDPVIYHGMAQMMADCNSKWEWGAIGFDEVWADKPARSV